MQKYLCITATLVTTSCAFGAAPAGSGASNQSLTAYIKQLKSTPEWQARPHELRKPKTGRGPGEYLYLITFHPYMSSIINEKHEEDECSSSKNTDVAILGLRDILQETHKLQEKHYLRLASKEAHALKLINKTTTSIWGITQDGNVTLLETVVKKNVPKYGWQFQSSPAAKS